LGEAGAGAQAH